MDKNIMRAELDIVLGLMEPNIEAGKGTNMAYIDYEKAESTRDIVAEYMDLEVVPPVEDLYTNEFLD